MHLFISYSSGVWYTEQPQGSLMRQLLNADHICFYKFWRNLPSLVHWWHSVKLVCVLYILQPPGDTAVASVPGCSRLCSSTWIHLMPNRLSTQPEHQCNKSATSKLHKATESRFFFIATYTWTRALAATPSSVSEEKQKTAKDLQQAQYIGQQP